MPKPSGGATPVLHVASAAVNAVMAREIRTGKFPLFVSAKWLISI